MDPRRKLCDDDLESKVICDIGSDEDIENAESDEDEEYCGEEEHTNTTSATTDYEAGTAV